MYMGGSCAVVKGIKLFGGERMKNVYIFIDISGLFYK